MRISAGTSTSRRLLRRLAMVLAVAGALAAAPSALAATVPAFGIGSTYQALVSAGHPATPSGWANPGFDDSGWASLAGPFSNAIGSSAGCSFPAGASSFPVSGQVLARKAFFVPAGATNLHITGTIDNNAAVYLNGALVQTVADGFCHTGGIDVVVAAPAPGLNVLAVQAEDTGGITFFDASATYDQSSIVTNGSFELGYPAVTNGPWWQSVGYNGYPDNLIPGWSETGNGSDWHTTVPSNPGEPAASDGVHAVDLIGNNTAGGISQTLATVPGYGYVATFRYAGHPGCVGGGTRSATASARSEERRVGKEC